MIYKHLQRAAVFLFAVTFPAFAGVAPPATTVTLGQAFMGPVGTSTAFTQLSITNRDLVPCEVQVTLTRGSTSAPPVEIDGELRTDNTAMSTIPRGGVQVLEFRSTVLVQGVIAVAVLAPCTRESLSVAGTYFVTDASGLLVEAFTIPVNDSGTWLTKDRCTAISYRFDPRGVLGIRSNLGLATSSVAPLGAPPEEMRLMVSLFDAQGAPLGESRTFQIDGIHSPFFPLDAIPDLEPQLLTLVICLETSEREKGFQLDLTAIGVKGAPLDVQFEAAIFADGFESGDVSAWSR